MASVRLVAFVGLLTLSGALCAQSNFGGQEPSVDQIVDQLRARPDDDTIDTGRTRALRPGAAAGATAAPEPAPKASISMQVQFAFNSTRIEGGSQQTMENLATALASPQLQDRSFTIVGHTDAVGSAAYNQRLSQARARSVRDFLVQRGVDASRLRTEGKGFSELVNTADPAADENRRVEIVATSH
ncbi:OmpA family protein [Luteimonas sp. BDR2-5]|uniref:OmpA family protein n=1 Tax=Proluteimonas luteida TaxID=2878685 RepID=UPI001E4E3C1A|nr:OmpA family protein [Luteimonas sp. BDR2-5]MCD9027914.1 OmpA family protein [Luteimonas sp. BDR2-5]